MCKPSPRNSKPNTMPTSGTAGDLQDDVIAASTDATKSVAPAPGEHGLVEARRITVCSGQFAHVSSDGGYSWATSLREVPGSDLPLMRGRVDVSRLPPMTKHVSSDFAKVLDDGFGAVAAHVDIADKAEGSQRSVACVYVTNDAGVSWKPLDLTHLSPRGLTQHRCSSWPPARFDSLLIPAPKSIILAWEDPWLFDWPMSHVVFSHDGGNSWQYNALGDSNPYLAHDFDNRLLCLNDGYFLLSEDGGETWRKEDFQIEWPPSYHERKVGLLRHVVFTDRNHGYGLIVHWSKATLATGVGLVVTTDNGRFWRHIATLPAPNFGDVNSRHALSLHLG